MPNKIDILASREAKLKSNSCFCERNYDPEYQCYLNSAILSANKACKKLKKNIKGNLKYINHTIY